jgi:hypothetical protein
MVITFSTAREIDEQVTKGLPIGSYGKETDVREIPRNIADWNIRPIEERKCPGTGYIIAVPSNTRTRIIYTRGRRSWLAGIGYSYELADLYIRASNTVKQRWDHSVASFVFDNRQIDEYVLNRILSSKQPRRTADDYGVSLHTTRANLVAGCQIVRNLLDLAKRKAMD